jgi:hypothetical protein
MELTDKEKLEIAKEYLSLHDPNTPMAVVVVELILKVKSLEERLALQENGPTNVGGVRW